MEESVANNASHNVSGCRSPLGNPNFRSAPLQYQFSPIAHLLGNGCLCNTIVLQKNKNHSSRPIIPHANRLYRLPMVNQKKSNHPTIQQSNNLTIDDDMVHSSK